MNWSMNDARSGLGSARALGQPAMDLDQQQDNAGLVPLSCTMSVAGLVQRIGSSPRSL